LLSLKRLTRNRSGVWRVEGVVTVNGEIASPPEIDAGLAAAALAVFAHRHEVIHLLYAATDEPDALARIGGLLRVPEATIARVLDQPFRWMLPQFRAELESIATGTPSAQPAPPGPAAPREAPAAPGPAAALEALAAPAISPTASALDSASPPDRRHPALAAGQPAPSALDTPTPSPVTT
jgi:hypothetical protein